MNDIELMLAAGEVVVEGGPFPEATSKHAVRARHLSTQIATISAARDSSRAVNRRRALAALKRALDALETS
jgi:hypothetical protein